LPRCSRSFCFSGRLSWKKGLDRLLRAFACTKAGKLAIVGTDDEGLAPRLRYIFTPMAKIDPPLLMAAHTLVRRDDVIWDIGANVGLFSLAAAVRAGDHGQVIAFEPDGWTAQLLRRTRRAQPITSAPITVALIAVARGVSLRSFSIAVRSRACDALSEYGSTQMGRVEEQHLVANLDWLLSQLPIPDIVKIDVEGAELEVLSNQVRMLNEVRPVIVCEVGSNTADEVTRLLTSESYCLFDGEKPLGKAQIVNRATRSTIAIPEEKKYRLPRYQCPETATCTIMTRVFTDRKCLTM
jgi:FkbM family methyltransferase